MADRVHDLHGARVSGGHGSARGVGRRTPPRRRARWRRRASEGDRARARRTSGVLPVAGEEARRALRGMQDRQAGTLQGLPPQGDGDADRGGERGVQPLLFPVRGVGERDAARHRVDGAPLQGDLHLGLSRRPGRARSRRRRHARGRRPPGVAVQDDPGRGEALKAPTPAPQR